MSTPTKVQSPKTKKQTNENLIEATLDNVRLVDIIGETSKVANIVFKIKYTNENKEHTNSFKVPFDFALDAVSKEITFVKKPDQAKFGFVDAYYHTKNLLFANSNKKERETLNKIFKANDASSLLTFRSRKESALLYIVDPEKKIEKLIYEIEEDKKKTKSALPEKGDVSEKEHRKIITISEQLALIEMLSVEIEESVGSLMSITDKRKKVLRCVAVVMREEESNDISYILDEKDTIDALFGQIGLTEEEGAMELAKLKKLVQGDFPLRSLQYAITEEEIDISMAFVERIDSYSISAPVYLDYSAERGQSVIDGSSGSRVKPMTFNSDIDAISLVDSAVADLVGEEEAEITVVKAFGKAQEADNYTFQGKTAKNYIGRLDIGEDYKKMNMLNHNPLGLMFLRCETKEKRLELAMELRENAGSTELMSFLPVNIEDSFYVVTAPMKDTGWKSSNPILSGKKEEERMEELIDAITITAGSIGDVVGRLADKIYNDLKRKQTSTIMSDVVNSITNIGHKSFQNYTQTGKGLTANLKPYIKTNINEMLNLMPDVAVMEAATKNVDSSEFFRIFSSLSANEKVFPNIQKVGGNRVSLRDIASSAFLSVYYMKIGEVAPTIKQLARENNISLPDIEPHEFDLVNPENNVLSEMRKEIEINPEKSAGILEFKLPPQIIKVDTKEAKDKFLDLSVKAIASAAGKREDEDFLKSTKAELNKELAGKDKALPRAKYAIMKMQPMIDENVNISQQEKFTLVDAELNELSVTNIPVFRLYDEMKKEGMIKKSDRVKKVDFHKKDIGVLFDGIVDMVNKDFEANKELESSIKSIFGEMIDAKVEGLVKDGKNFVPYKYDLPSDRKKFYQRLKASGIDKTIREKMNALPKEADKILSEITMDMGDSPLEDMVKRSFDKFLKKFYTGKEFTFSRKYLTEKAPGSIRSAMFKERKGEIIDIAMEKLMASLKEEGEKDDLILLSAAKMVNIYAFKQYVTNLISSAPEKGLSPEKKKEVFETFLTDIFGFMPHQVQETLGMMALWLSGKKSVEQLWWEMRRGKARASIALVFLPAIIKKGTGMFFIQSNNFDDIVGQAFETYPFMVLDHSTLLGKQTRFKLAGEKMPTSTTPWVFPNMPFKLKSKKVLLNPLSDSNASPAEVLSAEFQKVFNALISSSLNLEDSDFERILKQNEKHISSHELFFRKVPDTHEAKIMARATYLYVVKLIKDGYMLPESQNDDFSKVISRSLDGHWKDYKKSLESEEKTNGEIVFIGKQFISSYDGKKSAPKTTKLGKGLPAIETELDVSIKDNRGLASEHVHKTHFGIKINAMLSGMEFNPEWADKESAKSVFPYVRREKKGGMAKKEAVIRLIINRATRTLYDEFVAKLSGEEFVELLGENDVDVVASSARARVDEIFKKLITAIAVDSKICSPTRSPYFSHNQKPGTAKYVDIEAFMGQVQEKEWPAFGHIDGEEKEIETLFNSIFKDVGKLVKEINNSGYRQVVSQLYNPSAQTQTYNIRMSMFVEEGVNVRGSEFSLKMNFSKPNKIFYIPARLSTIYNDTNKKPGGDKIRRLSIASLSAKTPSKSDPSTYVDSVISPRECTFMASKGEGIKIIIHSATTGKGSEKERYLETNKKYDKNLSSPIMWSTDIKGGRRSQVCAIGFDEAHKEKGKNADKSKSICENIEEMNFKSGSKHSVLITKATGSPNSKLETYAEFIENTASGSIKNIAAQTRAQCGISSSKSLILKFLLSRGSTIPGIEDVISNYVKKAIVKTQKDSNKANIFEYADACLDELNDNVNFRDGFSMFKREQEEYPTHDETLNDMENILKRTAIAKRRSIDTEAARITDEKIREKITDGSLGKKSKTDLSETRALIKAGIYTELIKTTDTGLEATREAALAKEAGMVRPAPGFCNPVGLSMLTSFMENSNISISRTSETGGYEILDSGMSVDRGPSDLEKDSFAVLAFGSMVKKYRSAFSINGIKRSYIGLAELAIKGLRANCEEVFGMDTSAFNGLINPTQKTVKDSMIDSIGDLIVEGLDIPARQEEIFQKIKESITFISTQNKELSKLRKMLDDKDSAEFEFLPLKTVAVTVEEIKEITLGFGVAGLHAKVIGDKDNWIEPLDDVQAVISFAEKGLEIIPVTNGALALDKAMPIIYRTGVSYQPYEGLPMVNVPVNVSNVADDALFEAMAFTRELSELYLKSINNGDNTRIMSTRTSIIALGIIEMINALSLREDKDTPHTILVNQHNNVTKDFVQNVVLSEKYAEKLKENRIMVDSVDANSLNLKTEAILARGENFHVIGNPESFAEGVAMDTVQTGFYPSPISNIAMAIQSFARQRGQKQDTSRFYLFGGGNYFSIDLNTKQRTSPGYKFNDRHIEMRDIMNTGLVMPHSSYMGEKALTMMSERGYPLNINSPKRATSYINKVNKKTEQNFHGYETFMEGKGTLLDISSLDPKEKEEKIKEITQVSDTTYLDAVIIKEKEAQAETEEENNSITQQSTGTP